MNEFSQSNGYFRVTEWPYLISNAKPLIGGTFHGLVRNIFRGYLDEISYRYNRRHMLDRIFERCVVAMVECPIWTYWDIVGRLLILKNLEKGCLIISE